MRGSRAVDVVLIAALAVDVVLPTLACVRPGWWFAALHVHVVPDALHLAWLDRAAAQWVMFAATQLAALVWWRKDPRWLLIVAGVRASDWLTDVTYLAVAPELSPGKWVLLAPLLFNVGMTVFLVDAHRRCA